MREEPEDAAIQLEEAEVQIIKAVQGGGEIINNRSQDTSLGL